MVRLRPKVTGSTSKPTATVRRDAGQVSDALLNASCDTVRLITHARDGRRRKHRRPGPSGLLDPYLRDFGGHIGYDVRPTARRQGHTTATLAAALSVAYHLDITSALVTCDVDNVASRRVIERNGGIFADQRCEKLRLWVPTG